MSATRRRGPARPNTTGTLSARLRRLDWAVLATDLEQWGCARTGPLLSADECRELVGLFNDDARFRTRISMERYRFGAGDYAYFSYPLPPLVQSLRTALYRHLAPIANRWMQALDASRRYPGTLQAYLAECYAAGQRRPTPLLLRYTQQGYNALHRDEYGALAFPLQATVFLSRPGVDYEGGAFLLVEQHPRQQSRGDAMQPEQGEVVLFPNDVRPVRSLRGVYRARARHGVGRVTRGDRYTLGVIFHDAE